MTEWWGHEARGFLASRFSVQGDKMSLPENDYQILKLTDDFYNTYPNPPYIEILKKKQRAYNCILFQTHYGYFICVPYRREISHKYAY